MKYVSRKTRRKWKEEKDVLYLHELGKKCDELIKDVELKMGLYKEVV